MTDLNSMIIEGRLVKDAEIKNLENGEPMTVFTIATNRQWKDESGTYNESTDFFPISIFGQLSESITQYLRKGLKVIIEGSLRQIHTEKDGVKSSETRIAVRKIHLRNRPSKNQIQDEKPYESSPQESYEISADEALF